MGVEAILGKWPKRSNEYSIKQPSDFWEKDVYIDMWQSNWVVLVKRLEVSLTAWYLYKTIVSLG